MDALPTPLLLAALPTVLMLLSATVAAASTHAPRRAWVALHAASAAALTAALIAALLAAFGALAPQPATAPAWGLHASTFSLVFAAVVQALGLVVGVFSCRYLQGEPRQAGYVAAFASVLGGVQALLLADHWLVLIAAWAGVGLALERLLCFYGDRPFALLAAHKKRVADRAADALLAAAALLAWLEVGSGSLSTLMAHAQAHGPSPSLQLVAALVVGAVILRTALMPVHGWLIQVMEAPTPVSALLHAGVVNLGGVLLIRFAPLLEQSALAQTALVAVGLATAVLSGLVMLTRISIKVRLAWSTVAQMGFMVMECGLGLYTLAALHLVGHSLYKAHAFLSAGDAVRQARLRALHTPTRPTTAAVLLAPLAAGAVVWAVTAGHAPWPWWWSAGLALAWAPVLWRWAAPPLAAGLAGIALFTAVAQFAHALPLGLADQPQAALGAWALAGLAGLYAALALLQTRPQALSAVRRWSYAGFYLDEFYTRWSLRLWPRRWT